jgi:hypothetical protein
LVEFLAVHPNDDGRQMGAFVRDWQRRKPRGREDIERLFHDWNERKGD